MNHHLDRYNLNLLWFYQLRLLVIDNDVNPEASARLPGKSEKRARFPGNFNQLSYDPELIDICIYEAPDDTKLFRTKYENGAVTFGSGLEDADLRADTGVARMTLYYYSIICSISYMHACTYSSSHAVYKIYKTFVWIWLQF